MHESCFNELHKYAEENRKVVGCPVCRADIDIAQIKQLTYEEPCS